MSRIRSMLKVHEDIRAFPYRDTVGKLTIGIGRNLDDVGLSSAEIDFLFANDEKRTRAALERALPWVKQLDEVRYDVLLDMAFNMGVGDVHNGLLSFTRTLPLVKDGKYAEAAARMLESKWAGQVGGRAKRLAKMMETGQYPPEIT